MTHVCQKPETGPRRANHLADPAGAPAILTSTLVLVLVFVLQWTSPAWASFPTEAGIPRQDAAGPFAIHDSLRTRAAERLRHHVDADELRAWRDTCGAAEADAFDFLFAWLPPSDLSAWRADQIRGDIELALRTRGESPWAAEIPDGIFLTYVLPHRVAQEPIEPWRQVLHERLWDRVAGLPLNEAVLETNRFCREYATFRPGCPRDQGPLVTAEKGIGRCEEEMIFFICAARSVGIPARPCYTPAWMANDNNHAWVEAWTPAGWRYLGACEPAPDLNMAWFTGPARRAGLVLSVAYGEGGAPGEDVYGTGRGATLINSTGVYTSPGTVKIEWADLGTAASAMERAARDSTWVTVHVFNWGSLSPLGRFRAGDGLTLGPGDYVMTCGVDEIPMAARVTVEPGAVTRVPFDPREPDISRMGWLEIPFRLNIPDPDAEERRSAEDSAPPDSSRQADADAAPEEDEQPGPEVDPLVQQTHEANLARRDLERLQNGAVPAPVVAALAARIAGLEVPRAAPEETPEQDSREDHDSRQAPQQSDCARFRASLESLLAHLERAGPRAPRWARLAAGIDERLFPIALDLLLAMDEKDFFESDTLDAAEAVKIARSVRSWRARWETPVPDSIWAAHVLSPRIDHQPGDAALWTSLPLMTLREGTAVPVDDMLLAMGEIPAPADFIHAFFAGRVVQEPEYRLGHLNRPSEAWLRIGSMHGSPLPAPLTPASARIALIGLLRRNGIPARVDAERRWMEVWVEGDWVPADPFDPDSWNRREGTVAEAYAEPSILQVDFLDQGEAMTQVEGWKHFRLARWNEGRFEPLRAAYPVEDGRLEMPVEPAALWLFGGQRDESGSPWVHARRLHPAPGETLQISFDIGTPREEPDLPPARQIPMEAVRAIWSELGRRMPVLLYVWVRDSEPCIRTAESMLSGWSFIEDAGIPVVSCVLDATRGPYPRDLVPRSTARMSISGDEMGGWFGIEDASDLPVTALIDADGRTLLHLEGMQLAVVDLIRRAAREMTRH